MATVTKRWSSGTGSVTLTFNGQGDGTIQVSSSPNDSGDERSMQINIKTTNNQQTRIVTIRQLAAGAVDYVDLGLPSGTLWAKGDIIKDGNGNYRIGRPTDIGAYFPWAGIEGYNLSEGHSFNNTNAPYYLSTTRKFGKYSDGMTEYLEPMDDAATCCIGSGWRIPSRTEFDELNNYTTREWKNDYQGSGVSGMLFTSNVDGFTNNSIFMPACGRISNTSHVAQKEAARWTSQVYANSYAYAIRCYEEGAMSYIAYYLRRIGICIRPIMPPPTN